MRIFWSVVLAGGLLLAGIDVYEARRDAARPGSKGRPISSMMMEDGTPLPPPPPPPQH